MGSDNCHGQWLKSLKFQLKNCRFPAVINSTFGSWRVSRRDLLNWNLRVAEMRSSKGSSRDGGKRALTHAKEADTGISDKEGRGGGGSRPTGRAGLAWEIPEKRRMLLLWTMHNSFGGGSFLQEKCVRMQPPSQSFPLHYSYLWPLPSLFSASLYARC